jgi:hypothetical protein
MAALSGDRKDGARRHGEGVLRDRIRAIITQPIVFDIRAKILVRWGRNQRQKRSNGRGSGHGRLGTGLRLRRRCYVKIAHPKIRPKIITVVGAISPLNIRRGRILAMKRLFLPRHAYSLLIAPRIV